MKNYAIIGKMNAGWYKERDFFCDLVSVYRGEYVAIRWIK